MSDTKITCSSCHSNYDMISGKTLFGKIRICKECTYKILTLYIYNYPIKQFCPFCREDRDGSCDYCSISKRLETFSYENI